MVEYLRPETLFGTKFESYLKQSLIKKLLNGYM
ncbi:conserved phage C-terminal domain-containing protein, partial [Streptococcus agalactiae]